eukprot:TRINITY_DN15317_c0_g2_i3.p1 TRINITY_DN15317_c0_g2~~TRINITY_DN15317_c0_g2_i3.p1  ORF type:complete len:242 (-),score=81.20 TRINITY_DN15317_c0_g2_i3:145-870(-)
MTSGTVQVVSGRSQWDKYLKDAAAQKKLVVVDFTATWCGPCRMMAPFFQQLSEKYPNALFLKVDVDEHQDIAAEFHVRGIPAFHLLMGANKVDEMVGANQRQLEELVLKHYSNAAAPFQGQGQKLGSSTSPAAATSKPAAAPAGAAATAAGTGDGKWEGVDESKASTSIQIRLPNGTRLVGKFNLSHTVADIKTFIRASSSSLGGLPTQMQLAIAYPPKLLSSDTQTIEEAGLLNAAITVK